MNRFTRNLLLWLVLLGSLAGVGHWLYNQARHMQGLVRADPHTYISFAENLSQGSYTVDDPLARLTEKHLGASESKGLRPGPRWNWSVRADGKTVYTTAIGYPLVQAAVIKFGGKQAALYTNVVLWGVVFLCLFLMIWEGLGRGWAAAGAAGLGVLAVPWIETTVQIMVEPWREPLFLACLFGAAWLLMRFWRTGGLLAACGMALLLGYACSVKEANAVYLPAFGLLFLVGLFRKDQRAREQSWLPRLLLPALCGLLGLGPMFAHNYASSGNPFMSQQAQRATESARAPAPEAGEAAPEAPPAPVVKKGLNPDVQYQMAHAYWWEFSVNPGQNHTWFKPWWFALAMLGLIYFLRGTDPTWRALLAAIALGGLYAGWGYLEYELWDYDKITWQPRFQNVFQEHKLISWLLSLLAIGGLALACRRRLGGFLMAFVLMHFALYFSWKNIDFRHMLVAVVVYATCLGAGAFALTQLLGRWLKIPEAWRPALALPVVLAVLVPALMWRPHGGNSDALFSAEQGQAFGSALAQELEGDPVLFGNRYLSEVADLYLEDVPVMRLHELMHLQGENRDVQSLLADLSADHRLYYLASRDLDPKNLERGIDFARVDQSLFRKRHELREVWRFAPADYRLQFTDDRPAVILYEVIPRSDADQEITLDVPAGGAAFLRLLQRDPMEGQSMTLDGEDLALPEAFQIYSPVALSTNRQVVLAASGRGAPNLAEDAALVGWEERIDLPPVSRAFHEQTGGFVSYTGYEDLRGENELLLPVRFASNTFPVVGLHATMMPARPEVKRQVQLGARSTSNEHFVIESAGSTWERRGDEVSLYAALPDERTKRTERAALLKTFSLRCSSPDFYPRLSNLRSMVAKRGVTVRGDGRTTMLILYGRLALDSAAEKGPFAIRVNGKVVREGICYANPWRSVNEVKQILHVDDPDENLDIEVEGAGLVSFEAVPVRDRFEIPFGSRMALFPEAFHPPNPAIEACWTRGTFSVPVPVIRGAGRYTLTLDAADGEPDGAARPLTVRIGDELHTLTLSRERGEHHLTFDLEVARDGVVDLSFEQKTWSPRRRAERRGLKDAAELGDDRELGFRLYRMVWEPAWR